MCKCDEIYSYNRNKMQFHYQNDDCVKILFANYTNLLIFLAAFPLAHETFNEKLTKH